MNVTKVTLLSMFADASELMKNNSSYLSEIDAQFGDGDHGVTIKKIALLIDSSINSFRDDDLKNFIENLGNSVMTMGGGSAGPLWGTFLIGMSLPLAPGTTSIDPNTLQKMFISALEEMKDITTAGIGDKTMMDTLIPAVLAIKESSPDIHSMLKEAATAAIKGAEDTKGFIAKYGRAKNYKEKTIGTPDAGALSLSLFFQGLANGYNH